jgi:hypothetical protein
LKGLPLGMNITSCDTCERPKYINLCDYLEVMARFERTEVTLYCLEVFPGVT